MQDAVVLANYLYKMKSLSSADINGAFAEFKSIRFPQLKDQYESSKTAAKLIYGQVRKQQ